MSNIRDLGVPSRFSGAGVRVGPQFLIMHHDHHNVHLMLCPYSETLHINRIVGRN